MLGYIGKRLLIMIPVVLAIIFLVFTIVNTSPETTARLMLGIDADQESIRQMTHDLGLDKSFLRRFAEYVVNMCKGDFGTSNRNGTPVFDDIFARFPTTFKLAVFGILLAVFAGIPIGIISAIKQYSIIDNVSIVSALLLASLPTFWLGLMLMLLFSVKLGWMPATGSDTLKHFILPAITVSTATMAMLIRMTRSTMLELIRQDYVRTARAKGAPEKDVIFKHILRNSLLPIITIIGISFGTLLGGTIIVESVFSLPGIESVFP